MKELKSFTATFAQQSMWYQQLRHAGPWAYEWSSREQMAPLLRQLSSSYFTFACLPNPSLLPDAVDVTRASAAFAQRSTCSGSSWPPLLEELTQRHAQLDAELSPHNVSQLALSLAKVGKLVCGREWGTAADSSPPQPAQLQQR